MFAAHVILYARSFCLAGRFLVAKCELSNYLAKFLKNTPTCLGTRINIILKWYDWLRRKRGPVTLTRTAWLHFLPSPTPQHETCLCCSAMIG